MSRLNEARRRRRVIQSLRARDGDNCGICSHPIDFELTAAMSPKWAVSIDHITPSSAGGSNRQENLHLTHIRCNVKRSAGSLDLVRKLTRVVPEVMS